MTEKERRVLLAKRDLYTSGNSLAVSIPRDVLENTVFGVGEQVNIFTYAADGELVLTHDTKRHYDAGATPRGSRKVRTSSHGTILVTVPQDALLEDLGYASLDAADDDELRITIDPLTCDLYVEFPLDE